MTTTVMQSHETYDAMFEELTQRLAGEPAWLAERRQQAMARFRELGFPTRRDEAWRSTSLKLVTDNSFQPAPAADSAGAAASYYEGLDAHRLVFINGHFSQAHSDIGALPAGVIVCTMAEAVREHGELVREHFGTICDAQARSFAALNTALFTDGYFVHVAAGVKLARPVHVRFMSEAGAEPTADFTRSMLVVGEGAEATLIETHTGTPDALYFTCPVVENFIAKGAHVDHYKVQAESESAVHIGEQCLEEFGDSQFRSHAFLFGAALCRLGVFGYLRGEHIDAILNGLYVLRGKQHCDTFMQMEHVAANCDSHELYKGVLDGESSAVFRGRIYVHSEAQKTDAKQTNQNLLLTDKAQVMSKPQLEIYADDVKCTHGATTGELDKDAHFYLRARGIPSVEARNILIRAFAGDVTERVLIEPVKDKVEALLAARLPS